LAFLSGYLLHRFVEEGLPRILAPRPIAWAAIALTTATIAGLVAAALIFAEVTHRFEGSLWQLVTAG
ncbi:hypothetical protein ACSTHX_00025, partial [Vibrio parahaemolyticus]